MIENKQLGLIISCIFKSFFEPINESLELRKYQKLCHHRRPDKFRKLTNMNRKLSCTCIGDMNNIGLSFTSYSHRLTIIEKKADCKINYNSDHFRRTVDFTCSLDFSFEFILWESFHFALNAYIMHTKQYASPLAFNEHFYLRII